ncbi:MAG: Rossmann-like and DUF2520 domain-containing protein [Actinomycetota bacterium]|nr:Rossmann-like and DUF2520 domain-containing protein [Actinomycetota bacterium]
MAKRKDRFVIIGAGRVGTAVGHLLQKSGENVLAVASRSEQSLEQAGKFLESVVLTADVVKAGKKGNAIIIATPDDLIADTCLSLVSGGGVKKGDFIVHMSGALGLDVLRAAEDLGARTICIHPLQTFADVKGAVKRIPGSVFAVTARDESALKWAEDLVRRLKGEPVPLAEKDKILYHTGAVLACNLLVALEHAAELLYQEIGMHRDRALKALMPLVEGTVENLKKHGTEKALTGPVARGDIGVIRQHLDNMEREERDKLLKVYASLSLYALDLAEANMSKARCEEIEELLNHYL